jgi:hypothetical protein
MSVEQKERQNKVAWWIFQIRTGGGIRMERNIYYVHKHASTQAIIEDGLPIQ